MTVDFQTIFWECENRHQFNTGQVRDPGKCPVCQSWKIACKYPELGAVVIPVERVVDN